MNQPNFSDNILISTGITEIDILGDVIPDMQASALEACGVDVGDSLNILFSGGAVIEDLPYYDDFFGSRGETMLANLGGQLKLGGQYYDFAESYGITKDETLSIVLNTKGKYRDKYMLYRLPTGYNRSAYDTEEQFTNFRNVIFGEVAPGVLYRSASPVSDKYGRSKELGSVIKNTEIKTILNLADTKEKVSFYRSIDDHVKAMVSSGSVIFAGTGVNFYGDDFCRHLAHSLKEMSKKEAPYLIHCSLGRDRTGFVCAVLEALMGAAYEEITADYMQSFENVNMLDKHNEPEKYNLYQHELDDIFMFLTSAESPAEVRNSDLRRAAGQYLLRGGMTVEELELLKHRLTHR